MQQIESKYKHFKLDIVYITLTTQTNQSTYISLSVSSSINYITMPSTLR